MSFFPIIGLPTKKEDKFKLELCYHIIGSISSLLFIDKSQRFKAMLSRFSQNSRKKILDEELDKTLKLFSSFYTKYNSLSLSFLDCSDNALSLNQEISFELIPSKYFALEFLKSINWKLNTEQIQDQILPNESIEDLHINSPLFSKFSNNNPELVELAQLLSELHYYHCLQEIKFVANSEKVIIKNNVGFYVSDTKFDLRTRSKIYNSLIEANLILCERNVFNYWFSFDEKTVIDNNIPKIKWTGLKNSIIYFIRKVIIYNKKSTTKDTGKWKTAENVFEFVDENEQPIILKKTDQPGNPSSEIKTLLDELIKK